MNSSFTPPANRFRKNWLAWLAAAVGLAAAGYLAASALTLRIGFPLDDAWIHQTYARNFALRGEWSFLPGQPSAGSTAPLWSLLLSAGYVLRISPQAWAFGLGTACLLGLAVSGQAAAASISPRAAGRLPWVGLFLAGEWHLVWAALSGMETGLMALLILAAAGLLLAERPRWRLVGALAGVSVWVRPDGLTLLGPALFTAVLGSRRPGEMARAGGETLAAFAVFFLPYLLFNRALAGSWWPNTFYAKQAEYAILNQLSLIERLGSLFKLPMVGAGVLLLPGLGYLLWKSWRQRRWAVWAAFLWWAGYTSLYAWRLPVTYQHGRYLMPAMPVYFLLGLSGTLELIALAGKIAWQRILARALALSIAGVWLAFYLNGAAAYAQDVAIIESEMVATSRWVAENTPPDSYIAAHDIGALGYFGQRRLLDLAGLISPEVIPFIRDEARLGAYLDQQQVDYLVTFPGWYPLLSTRGRPIFASGATFAPANGGENMAVFHWR